MIMIVTGHWPMMARMRMIENGRRKASALVPGAPNPSRPCLGVNSLHKELYTLCAITQGEVHTVYNEQYTLGTITQWAVHTAHCVQWAAFTVQCIFAKCSIIIHFTPGCCQLKTLHTAHCILHTAHCTLNTKHCTLHTATTVWLQRCTQWLCQLAVLT